MRFNGAIGRLTFATPGRRFLAVGAMRDRLRALLRSSIDAARGLAMRAGAPRRAMLGRRIAAPERLRVAPPDIRTGDATVADEMRDGYFSFRGKTLRAQDGSPFAAAPPSAPWRRALLGFSWLRHFRRADEASGGESARQTARGLVTMYFALKGMAADDPALEAGVTARRTLSFLAHAPMLLGGAPAEFRDDFMTALAFDAKTLARALGGAARGADRLRCALALLEFCICADVAAELRTQATKLFVDELERQILSDGGHIDRNPQTTLDLALDLEPLLQLYAARGIKPPGALPKAIGRMSAMLRLLQHGDGSLALFNGMSATDPGELAAVFAHETRGVTPEDAPSSGYRRMTAGNALVLFDVGAPPPLEFSRFAHAGALAFVFSLGAERVVVNCGAPAAQFEAARETARATAAHSTLVIDDTSSSRIEPVSEKRGAGLIVGGPAAPRVERRRSRMGEVIEATHDGYLGRFGLAHERVLALTHDGARLIGQERLIGATKNADKPAADAPRAYAVRFHLHPSVRVAPRDDGRGVELTLPSGAMLLFEASGGPPRLEESIFFAGPEGARKTIQIVLTGDAKPGARVRWSFSSIEREPAGPEELDERLD